MKSEIILVGGGGHCKSCIDVIEHAGAYEIAGIIDVAGKLHQRVLNYEIIATDNDLPNVVKEYDSFLITLGHIKSPDKRIKLFKTLKDLGAKFPVIISPYAYISKHTQIGEGTIVMHHALINVGVKIGINCIINTKALIEHDSIIGNHCHIATNAVINGGVKVGARTFFGSNAVSKEYIEIAEDSVIGCGAKITKNIPSDFSKFED
jgi:sugar O-acyltransferase (sialic acid O-acetyltransferase NeuD family)